MRVKIGKYTSWFGPYQLAELLCFWAKEEKDEYGISRKPHWVHTFGEWLAHGSVEPDPEVGDVRSWDRERHHTLLSRFLSWVHSKKQRKIQVHIDRWDTWSMDNTLSHIILPMLRQLRTTNHGAPYVDDQDVPAGLGLRSTEAGPKENEWDVDENHHDRWDWVLGEMIFAFECKVDDSWQEQFRSGKHDIVWVPVDEDGNAVPKGEHEFYQMMSGPNDTYQCDYAGMKVVEDRIQNGLRLFGKYFQALWD